MNVTELPKPRALIGQTDLKRLARLATSEGVQVEVTINGTTIRLTPAAAPAPESLDETEESALDRELAAFESRHGYI